MKRFNLYNLNLIAIMHFRARNTELGNFYSEISNWMDRTFNNNSFNNWLNKVISGALSIDDAWKCAPVSNFN